MANYNLRAFYWKERWDTPSPVVADHVKVRELIELHRAGRIGPFAFKPEHVTE